MEIMKGMVKDAGYPDVECKYGKVDDKIYYFVTELPNGNIVASTVLKEAINHAPNTSLGIINKTGDILVPFENKEIRQVKDDLLFVEKNIPSTPVVTAAINDKADPTKAQQMTDDVTKIKEQLNSIMGLSGDFIFENPYSEGTLYTMDGINVSGGYFSFIAESNGDYYFTTSKLNDQIVKFNPEVLENMNQQPPIEANNGQPESAPATSDVPPENPEVPTASDDPAPEATEESEQAQTDDSSLGLSIGFTANEDTPSDNGGEEVANENAETTPTDEEVPAEQTEDISQTDEVPAEEAAPGAEEVPEEPTEDVPQTDEVPAEEGTTLTDEEVPNEEAAPEEPLDEQAESVDEDAETAEEDINIPSDDEEPETTEEEVTGDEEMPQEEEQPEESSEEPVEESSVGVDINNDSRQITYDDMSNPVIADATNTIKKLLNENSSQRQQIDRLNGEIVSVRSQYDIIHEDNQIKEKEILTIRSELVNARNVTTALTRENIKLGATINKNKEIIAALEDQNQKLREQVAGLHALGSAVAEANVLIEPMDDDSGEYEKLN